MQQKFFEKNGRKIAYKENGSGEKVVLCAHSIVANSSSFDSLSASLSKDYRVIAPDAPGRGKSDRLNRQEDYNYDFYVQDIIDLVKFLNIKKCYWVGTSMGGITAMLFNKSMPGFIEKLILGDVAPQLSYSVTKRIEESLLNLPDEFPDFQTAINIFKKTYSGFMMRQEELEEFTRTMLEKTESGKFINHYDKKIVLNMHNRVGMHPQILNEGDWSLLEQIQAPLAVVWGLLSQVLTLNMINKIKQIKSDSTIIKVPNAAHLPTFMRAEMIELIHSWLNGKCDKQEYIIEY